MMKQIILDELNETLGDFLVKNKDVVYSAILDSIESRYLEENLSQIDILEINSQGEKSYVTLSRKDWIRSLNQAIEFFQKPTVEEYEKCGRCLKIANYLQKVNKID
jgi:hypothetical protein